MPSTVSTFLPSNSSSLPGPLRVHFILTVKFEAHPAIRLGGFKQALAK